LNPKIFAAFFISPKLKAVQKVGARNDPFIIAPLVGFSHFNKGGARRLNFAVNLRRKRTHGSKKIEKKVNFIFSSFEARKQVFYVVSCKLQ
jgi:hypothetical protein